MSWASAPQVNITELRRGVRYRRHAAAGTTGLRTDPDHTITLVCFSHLRWHFVYQRPQHLMTRFAQDYRVLFVEEPVETDALEPWLDSHSVEAGIRIVVPRIPKQMMGPAAEAAQRALLDDLFLAENVRRPVLWYFTPMAYRFSAHVAASLVVYDCMDELAAFMGAPPQLVQLERALLERAHVVFTGGVSLFEVKRHLHPNIHPFPSSVDVAHFAQARTAGPDPEDQAKIGRPRLGFHGVIDERLDLELLDAVAGMRPDWQFVLVGPVVKIEAAALPGRPNIHQLGPKLYEELPFYLAGWDVALLPFAHNAATRFISPTKTPEYLAAGRPVVSTPITDVVRTYGDAGLVRIAATPETFVAAIEAALAEARQPAAWLAAVDALLAQTSWDNVCTRMRELMQCAA